jgi:DNA-binding response OmpR family regulator
MKSRSSRSRDKAPACWRVAPLADPETTHARKILIVDPDAPMRGLISGSLRHHGYGVSETDDPNGGLLLVANGDRFDLVIIDLGVKTTGGVALARTLLDKGATSAVLFMTEDGPIARVLSRSIGAGMLLYRPFTAEDFRRRVEEVLRRASHAKDCAPRNNMWTRQRLGVIGNQHGRRVWRSSIRRTDTVDPIVGMSPQESVN